MAGEATHPDLINGSLVGILSELEQDKTFLKLAAGRHRGFGRRRQLRPGRHPRRFAPGFGRPPSGRVWPANPAKPVVLVVASGREAEETVGSLRSWYDGDRTTSPSSKPGKPCRTSV